MNQELILPNVIKQNYLIGDLFDNVEFERFRNNVSLLWIRHGKEILKECLKKLLEFDCWTKVERVFLERIKEIILPRIDKSIIVTLTRDEAKEILGLSIESMAGRDRIIEKQLLEATINIGQNQFN